MYGVPADIPLEPLVGREVTTVRIGLYQVRVEFLPDGEISIEGTWELGNDATGLVERVERSQDIRSQESLSLHRLLGSKVARFKVDPPTSFTLFLDNGYFLSVFDDSDQYESFSLHLEGQDVWI